MVITLHGPLLGEALFALIGPPRATRALGRSAPRRARGLPFWPMTENQMLVLNRRDLENLNLGWT